MMVRRPACGNALQAHEPHLYDRPFPEDPGSCAGWTHAEASASQMLAEFLQAVHDHRGAYPAKAPPLRFEVGPAAELALAQIIDPGPFPIGTIGMRLGGGAHIDELFGVPLVLSRDLPSRGWRLIVPGPVIASGEVTL